jgi:phage terminase Nu1 subunit (DNA packaging protein)
MARLLVVTERTVDRLAAEGVLVRSARGKFELVASVQGYVRYLRKHSLGDLQGSDEMVGLKTRMINARTRLAESEADHAAGRTLLKSDVEAVWLRVVTNMRTRMLALPARVAPMLQAAVSPGEASAILTDAVHDALTDLSGTEVTATPRGGRIPGAD